MPKVPGLILIEIKILMLLSVSHVGKDPQSIFAHRNISLQKNPPFGTGIKTIGSVMLVAIDV